MTSPPLPLTLLLQLALLGNPFLQKLPPCVPFSGHSRLSYMPLPPLHTKNIYSLRTCSMPVLCWFWDREILSQDLFLLLRDILSTNAVEPLVLRNSHSQPSPQHFPTSTLQLELGFSLEIITSFKSLSSGRLFSQFTEEAMESTNVFPTVLPTPGSPSSLSSSCLYPSARAAVTKYHRQGGFNNRNLFPQHSRGWESEIKVLAGVVSSGASLCGLQMLPFLCVFTCPFFCVSVS